MKNIFLSFSVVCSKPNHSKSRVSDDVNGQIRSPDIHETLRNIPCGKQTEQMCPVGMCLCVRMDVLSSLPVQFLHITADVLGVS